jgi:tRNA threonylcarbamoyladenosine biosynthesis protein TsaE
MESTDHALAEFLQAAGTFGKSLKRKARGATLITLTGELGAGKTAFVKAVARSLGVVEDVMSPTFVLLKSYPTDGTVFERLIHIDAYRLKSGEELTPLHFDEYMRKAENLIMLEWPEQVADALPTPDVQIAIHTLPDGSRKVTYG